MDHDFFSLVGDAACAPHPTESVAGFAQAVESRKSSPLLNLPSRADTPPTAYAHARGCARAHACSSAPPSVPSPFSAVLPADLPRWLDDLGTLVVDIRAHNAYNGGRVPDAISLCVPSTLLKRPNYSLKKLSEMLPSSVARARFSAWSSVARILVYDADAVNLGPSGNVSGLLNKFKCGGFSGELAWLKGGYQAVWRERRSLLDLNPPPDEDDDESDNAGKPPNAALRTKRLPMNAFSLVSTTAMKSSPSVPGQPTPQPHQQAACNPFFDTIRQNEELSQGITERIPLCVPHRVRRRIHDLPFRWLRDIVRKGVPPNDNNFVQTVSTQDVDEGTEALAKQFYRIEFAEQQRLMSIMEHHVQESTLHPPPVEQYPTPVIKFPYSITAGFEKGEKNRYRHIWPFEHARVRLHHHKAPPTSQDNLRFQSSLSLRSAAQQPNKPAGTAVHSQGLQLPLHLSSVILPGPVCDTACYDDYVNASYVQPLGTRKRYIATQGPLPTTFVDFWTLCWEQNVHVIVMLTREVEGSQIKCGAYWAGSVFGPLRLTAVESNESEFNFHDDKIAAGYFASAATAPNPSTASTSTSMTGLVHASASVDSADVVVEDDPPPRSRIIRRVFRLSHTAYSGAPPRKIVQLQFLDWPDMNVPEDPRCVLDLVREVDGCVKQADEACTEQKRMFEERTGRKLPELGMEDEVDPVTGIALHAMTVSPILLHCSAGVGRTGGFIAVDAVLDAIRREVRKSYSTSPPTAPSAPTEPPAPIPPPIQSAPGTPHTPQAIVADTDSPFPSSSADVIMGSPDKHVASDNSISSDFAIFTSHDMRRNDWETTQMNGLETVQIPAGRSGPDGVSYVMHVPVAVISRNANDTMCAAEGQSTREWAQDVMNQTGAGTMLPLSKQTSTGHGSDHAGNDWNLRSRNVSSGEIMSSSCSGTDESVSNFAVASSGFCSSGDYCLSTDLSRSSTDFGFRSPAFGTKSSSLATSTEDVVAVLSPKLGLPNLVSKDYHHFGRLLPDSYRKMPASEEARQPSAEISVDLHRRAVTSSPLSAPSSTFSVGARPNVLEPRPQRHGLSPFGRAGHAWLDRGRSFTTSPLSTESIALGPDSIPQSVLPSPSASPSVSPPPLRDTRLSNSVEEASSSGVAGPSDNSSDRPSASQPLANSARDVSAARSGVGFKSPRALHSDLSPKVLSEFQDPILEVIQDMREQRMSLCQSLRQYVFVHAAVIEGALVVVDEERARAREMGLWQSSEAPVTAQPNQQQPKQPSVVPDDDMTRGDNNVPSPSKGKRGASPTELLKEDRTGAVQLTKRPSIKSRPMSDGQEKAQFDHVRHGQHHLHRRARHAVSPTPSLFSASS